MDNIRKHGNPPYKIAVIHGGPGAPGSAAPIARGLSSNFGVLEPLQAADSVEGSIIELKSQLEDSAELPVVLIGASWGAMLSYMFAARFPEYVSKVIMVGSGVYEDKYAEGIMETRLSRLTESEKKETLAIMKAIGDPSTTDKDKIMSRFGSLMLKTDTYNPIPIEQKETEGCECKLDIHVKVWADVEKLRKSRKLLELGRSIECPVVAIHGDYDPHPIEGVRKPLSRVLSDFRFIVLKNCGHEPWFEKEARAEFFSLLKHELHEFVNDTD